MRFQTYVNKHFPPPILAKLRIKRLQFRNRFKQTFSNVKRRWYFFVTRLISVVLHLSFVIKINKSFSPTAVRHLSPENFNDVTQRQPEISSVTLNTGKTLKRTDTSLSSVLSHTMATRIFPLWFVHSTRLRIFSNNLHSLIIWSILLCPFPRDFLLHSTILLSCLFSTRPNRLNRFFILSFILFMYTFQILSDLVTPYACSQYVRGHTSYKLKTKSSFCLPPNTVWGHRYERHRLRDLQMRHFPFRSVVRFYKKKILFLWLL